MRTKGRFETARRAGSVRGSAGAIQPGKTGIIRGNHANIYPSQLTRLSTRTGKAGAPRAIVNSGNPKTKGKHTTMKKEELAKQLDGREYRYELDGFENRDFIKKHGLVVIFGYSDDAIELEGAVNDELYVDKFEVTRNAAGQLEVINYSNMEADEHAQRELEKAGWTKPEVVFSVTSKNEGTGGYPWFLEADVPYAPFSILEDGEKFCRGIVIDTNELIDKRHVDKWCENPRNDGYARFVLSVMRMPAYTEQDKFASQFLPLYCDYEGVRSRVDSVSRLGTIQLENQNGNHTAWPDECTKWSRHI